MGEVSIKSLKASKTAQKERKTGVMPTPIKKNIKIFKEKLKKNCVKGLTFNAFLLYYYKRYPYT